jgi:hypothetical protein
MPEKWWNKLASQPRAESLVKVPSWAWMDSDPNLKKFQYQAYPDLDSYPQHWFRCTGE